MVGYTTDFEGEFECRRLEEEGIGPFLRVLHAGDHTVLAPLADWLIERGDPRGERLVGLLHDGNPSTAWRLFGMRAEHAAYLQTFSKTRRMRRDSEKARHLADPRREVAGLPIGEEGSYFVGGLGFHGQEDDVSVLDHNRPPTGQPGLWCQWAPNGDGTAVLWNGSEKFYNYVEWLEYLVAHFLGPWGYVLEGSVCWRGEEDSDEGVITVKDNRVEAVALW